MGAGPGVRVGRGVNLVSTDMLVMRRRLMVALHHRCRRHGLDTTRDIAGRDGGQRRRLSQVDPQEDGGRATESGRPRSHVGIIITGAPKVPSSSGWTLYPRGVYL